MAWVSLSCTGLLVYLLSKSNLLTTLVSLMMKGRNNGKKMLALRIVAHAFEIIHLLTDQNPIQVCGVRGASLRCVQTPVMWCLLRLQVLVDAIVNTGPREDSTRIGSQGTVRRQAVDVSPLRRVNQSIALLTIGVSAGFGAEIPFASVRV